MIDGHTALIAHIGYPTATFKSPMIYNPYFEKVGVNAVVMPMGVKAEGYPAFLDSLFRIANLRGALVTMPLKVLTLDLMDETSIAAKVAGACNAIRLDQNGRRVGDMFDGEGFVRGVKRKGRSLAGASALVVGSGGVGSAIAAALAGAGVARLGLFDAHPASADALAQRLRAHYPQLGLVVGSRDAEGYEIVVNATPLGMKQEDPLPMDVARISAHAFVGEVVMKAETTPFLAAARARGCDVQVGIDMLFEQIPAYLEFFGFPAATADELRAVARISY